MKPIPSPLPAWQYDTEVTKDGRIELPVPLAPGQQVIVFVIAQAADSSADLLAASQSTLDFWDNPVDDEDWNDT